MADKKDGAGQGAGRGAGDPTGKRPFATIDLKAEEVRAEPPKGQAEAKSAASTAAQSQSADQAATAAKVAAAGASLGTAKASASTTAETGSTPANAKSTANAPDQKSSTVAGTAATIPAGTMAARQGSSVGRFMSHLVAGILGGALALVGGQHILPLIGLDGGGIAPAPTASVSPDMAGRLAALEKSVRERLSAEQKAPSNQPAIDAGIARIDDLGKQLAAMAEQQAKLAADNAALKEAMGKPQGADTGERVGKLEDQLSAMVAAAAANPAQAGRLPQLAQLTGKVADLETAMTSRLSALRKDVTTDVEARLQASTEASEAAKSGAQRLDREVATVKSDVTRLTQRADQLKSSSDRLEQSVKVLQDDAAGLKTALDGFRGEVDGRLKGAAKPADVASAIQPMTEKVTALEQNLQGVLKADQDRKSTAERIVLSLELGNLKRAVERGTKFSSELAEVRKIAGKAVDLAPLERFENDGVPTLADLAKSFRPLAGQIVDAEQDRTDSSVMDRLMTGAKGIVRIRKTAYAPTDTSAEAVTARMEVALKEQRLGDVLTEAKKLPPQALALKSSQDWIGKIEARQSIELALSAIDSSLKAALAPSAKGDKQ